MAKQTKGDCTTCSRKLALGSMTRHLRSCRGPGEHLLFQVRAAWGGPWWLYLAVAPDATLTDLDQLLRDLWLECCWHISAFRIGNNRFHSQLFDGWREGPRSMDLPIGEALAGAQGFHYEYDFGSTTPLVGKLVGAVDGDADTVLARNDEVHWPCDHCDALARFVSPWSGELSCGCDGSGEDGSLPVVNSPRMGVCGYVG